MIKALTFFVFAGLLCAFTVTENIHILFILLAILGGVLLGTFWRLKALEKDVQEIRRGCIMRWAAEDRYSMENYRE